MLNFSVHGHMFGNHLLLINLRDKGITGSKAEKICEYVNISVNKNTVYGDKSALSPNGIRVGTACMTTRGMNAYGWEKVAEWLLSFGCCYERLTSPLVKEQYLYLTLVSY